MRRNDQLCAVQAGNAVLKDRGKRVATHPADGDGVGVSLQRCKSVSGMELCPVFQAVPFEQLFSLAQRILADIRYLHGFALSGGKQITGQMAVICPNICAALAIR
ncbi:MAG: hypothetical protein IJC01_01185, partial [Clostridia bacterium]|nr:hypothetical protein [Clostridia bacterium]